MNDNREAECPDDGMTKVTVHHAITGADYRENARSGFSVTACSLPPDQKPRLDFTDPGHQESPRVLGGRTVRCWRPNCDSRTYWAEAKVWPDDSPDRCKLRRDDRRGYCRAHVVLWPSEQIADRLRDQVPFVDPLTLDPKLRTTPPPTRLEDDPCPHCNGTGTRSKPPESTP